jgi:GGDEF domain-containing protein
VPVQPGACSRDPDAFLPGERHIVLSIEIDRLDAFERLYGLEVGDRLMEHVAATIVDHGDDGLVLVRHGHGFTVLLPECTTRQRAGELASLLARAIADPYIVDGRRLHVLARVRVERPRDLAATITDDEDATLRLP